jgi:hypothetical protein
MTPSRSQKIFAWLAGIAAGLLVLAAVFYGSSKWSGAVTSSSPPATGTVAEAPARPLDTAPPPTPAAPVGATSHLSPSTSIQSVDAAVRALDWGNIVFSAPDTMPLDRPQTFELVLSPTLSFNDLGEQLGKASRSDRAAVHISPQMEATLKGEDFLIEALDPPVQTVASSPPTSWKWQVTPTKEGIQTLQLDLSAHIDVAGHDTPLVVKTFSRDIQVTVTMGSRFWHFVRTNWQWLWAALGVPTAAYFLRRKKNA